MKPGAPPLYEQSGRPSSSAVARKNSARLSMNARSSSLKSRRASFSSSRSARRRVSKRSCSSRMPAWYAGDVSSFMALLLREDYRLRRLRVDVQPEQVRPRVVADDVESAPRDRGRPALAERWRRATWRELARRYLRECRG